MTCLSIDQQKNMAVFQVSDDFNFWTLTFTAPTQEEASHFALCQECQDGVGILITGLHQQQGEEEDLYVM